MADDLIVIVHDLQQPSLFVSTKTCYCDNFNVMLQCLTLTIMVTFSRSDNSQEQINVVVFVFAWYSVVTEKVLALYVTLNCKFMIKKLLYLHGKGVNRFTCIC